MHYKLKGPGQILKAVFLSILMVLVLSEFANAKVSGVCSNCHTMHNSQNGTGMVSDIVGGQGTTPACAQCHSEPRQVLLRLNCLGCHAQNPTGGASNIVQPNNMPQVAHNAITDLAGGNYRHIITGSGDSDTYGHNVHGFGSIGTDNNLVNTPPGYNSAYDPPVAKYQTSTLTNQIMCAGQNGCHGNREQLSQMLAIKGSHHADDSILKFGTNFTETGQGTTAGTSYRFLYKVHGAEDANWEGVTPGPTVHNEYKGAVFGARSGQTWNQISTISQFCAECHGDFHASGSIGSASPWLRHPTDVVLPNSGEYTAYNTDGITYSLEAPVARQIIPNAASGTITLDSDIVMCLSCHRAHASQYPDALRWDYSNMSAGRGCYICHTQKDDNL